jgi:hypothetical protein
MCRRAEHYRGRRGTPGRPAAGAARVQPRSVHRRGRARSFAPGACMRRAADAACAHPRRAQTIVSDAARIAADGEEKERFLDPRSKQTFLFDHLTLVRRSQSRSSCSSPPCAGSFGSSATRAGSRPRDLSASSILLASVVPLSPSTAQRSRRPPRRTLARTTTPASPPCSRRPPHHRSTSCRSSQTSTTPPTSGASLPLDMPCRARTEMRGAGPGAGARSTRLTWTRARSKVACS